MTLASDVWGPVASVVAVGGLFATWAGLYFSRKSTREANSVQKEAVDAQKKLNEVEALQGVVETLNGEVDRLKTSLHEANDSLDQANIKAWQLNAELRKAQRNVRVLSEYYEKNAPHIPFPASHLEPMTDVN